MARHGSEKFRRDVPHLERLAGIEDWAGSGIVEPTSLRLIADGLSRQLVNLANERAASLYLFSGSK